MSINYIGRVIHNIKDFYSEINGATLTGAIDVVVVQQPDGNYTCSPFHVRFGKLGVLRSKEKIVDIEINGDPRDIHMKLGESGEAFFVEELLDSDNEEIPEHLATSPIPVSHFEDLYKSSGRRRNSIDLGDQQNKTESKTIQNEVNDYTKRRNTADNNENKKKLERDFIQRQIDLGNIEIREMSVENLVNQSSRDELIFNMDDVVDSKVQDEVETSQIKVRRSMSTPLVSVHLEPAVPVQTDGSAVQQDKKRAELVVDKLDESVSNEGSKSGKKKRRKKTNMKKKGSRKVSSGLVESSGANFETDNVTDGNHITKDKAVESNEVEDKSNSLTNSTTSSNGSSQQDLKDPSKDPSTGSGTMQPVTSNDTATPEEPATPNDISSCSSKKVMDPDFHFFSDTELTSAHQDDDYDYSRSNTPTATDNVQSDTEFEVKKSKDGSDASNATRDGGKNWAWGELPTQPKTEDTPTGAGGLDSSAPTKEEREHNSMLSSMFSFMKHSNRMRGAHPDGGVYLADISSGAIDPEVAALYFGAGSKKKDADMDCESGNGPSLAQSPVLLQSSPNSPNNSPEGCKSIDSDFDDQLKMRKLPGSRDVALSLCGWQPTPPPPESFLRHLVPFSDLCNDPIVFESPNLVVRVRDRYYTWKVAAPLICASVIYQRTLPQSTVDQLCAMFMPKDEKQEQQQQVEKAQKSYSWSWSYFRRSRRSNNAVEGANADKKLDNKSPNKSTVVTVEEDDDRLKEMKVDIEAAEEGYHGSSSGSDHGQKEAQQTNINEKYRKSLRLTSDQIKRLNLKDGINKVEFTVTTAYQGTSRCNCSIYKWKWNDKIVISDIDGTITKSDVLGHILPIVGKDWAQSGVAELFNKIHNNGYKLLYLSARAIGQSRTTREYLKSIRQGPGDLCLPDGPVLLNPTSLLTAFHREVIEKKPEKFKISCMSDIRALFPNNMQPFYAGYGNRINDVWAYTAVGIPIVRIFTINPKGELKHELTQTFPSSYTGQSLVVNDVFPPLINKIITIDIDNDSIDESESDFD